MRVVQIAEDQKFLFELLAIAKEEDLILQTTDGQLFVLRSLEDWQGFDVGDSDDFEQEVNTSSENRELMAFLAERRSNGERVPMADVKKQLGLI